MAVNLTAIFRVRDQGTSRLRRITQMMNRMTQTSHTAAQGMNHYRDANGRLHDSLGRFVAETNRANTSTGLFATRVNGLRVGTNGLSASIGGMQSALIGLAGAYLSAQGAAKAFDMTIGAAARYEQAEVAVKAIFNDTKKSTAYLQMVDKMAIDSPLLNSGEMLKSSKAIVAMTKDVDELGKAWSIIERLMVLDPTQGTDGAAFALKEMWQGDAISMVERFGLNKGELNDIKKMSIPEQNVELDKMLNKMGITQKTVNAMGETTLGYWAQMQERVDKFMRQVGNLGNSKLGDTLGKIVEAFDNTDLDGIAAKLDAKLASLVDNAIAFGKFVWKWREPIAYIAGALTAALGAFAIVGIIAALANPVSLIAAGIAAAAVGFKALYDNSETFRGAIEKVVTVVKDLWSVFQKGGVEGLISVLFPPDVAEKINGIITGIKSKISELMTAFNESGVGGVFDKIFGEGSFESIKTKFEEVKAYIDEKVTQFKGVFDRLKEAFSKAWITISDIISNVWSIIEPYLSGFWNILQVIGDIAMKVFDNIIAPAISFLVQLFSTLWSIAKPILLALSIAWEALSAVIKWVWDNVLAPLVDFILTGVKNAFDNFSGALAIVQGWFETLSGWVSTAYGHVKDFIGFIGKAKMPSWITNGISAGVNFVGDLIGAGEGKKGGKKSHYSGLDSVPYDGYSARLHKGERVLTARENKDYSEGNSGGITIAKLADSIVIREEADIDKFAYKLAKLIEKERTQVG